MSMAASPSASPRNGYFFGMTSASADYSRQMSMTLGRIRKKSTSASNASISPMKEDLEVLYSYFRDAPNVSKVLSPVECAHYTGTREDISRTIRQGYIETTPQLEPPFCPLKQCPDFRCVKLGIATTKQSGALNISAPPTPILGGNDANLTRINVPISRIMTLFSHPCLFLECFFKYDENNQIIRLILVDKGALEYNFCIENLVELNIINNGLLILDKGSFGLPPRYFAVNSNPTADFTLDVELLVSSNIALFQIDSLPPEKERLPRQGLLHAFLPQRSPVSPAIQLTTPQSPRQFRF